MNEDLTQAPDEQDVILYFVKSRPPVIAGYFQDCWKTPDCKEIDPSMIKGWALIPHYEYHD